MLIIANRWRARLSDRILIYENGNDAVAKPCLARMRIEFDRLFEVRRTFVWLHLRVSACPLRNPVLHTLTERHAAYHQRKKQTNHLIPPYRGRLGCYS